MPKRLLRAIARRLRAIASALAITCPSRRGEPARPRSLGGGLRPGLDKLLALKMFVGKPWTPRASRPRRAAPGSGDVVRDPRARRPRDIARCRDAERRSTRSITVTEAGAAYYQRARGDPGCGRGGRRTDRRSRRGTGGAVACVVAGRWTALHPVSGRLAGRISATRGRRDADRRYRRPARRAHRPVRCGSAVPLRTTPSWRARSGAFAGAWQRVPPISNSTAVEEPPIWSIIAASVQLRHA